MALGPLSDVARDAGVVLFSPGDSHHLLARSHSMEKSHLETAHRPLVASVVLTHSHLPGGALLLQRS